MLLGLVLLVLFVASFVAVRRTRARYRRLPYPPTPPGHFLWGNMEIIDSKQPRDTYFQLAKRYGDIFHVSAFGQHIVVLSSIEATEELFNRRSQVYSDRPENPMANLMGWGRTAVAFLPYGSLWRSHRRLFQQGFNANVVRESCHPIQSEKMNGFLLKLLTSPDDFIHHTEMLIGSVILKYVYGREIEANAAEDPLFSAATRSVRNLTTAMLPGQWLVNAIPALQVLPEWLPGCYFRTFARETEVLTLRVIEGGYEEAILLPENESLVKTLCEKVTTQSGANTDGPKIVKEVCGSAYGAAAETTRITLGTFFLLMREYPEVQRRTQEELTRVIGANRLPEFTDRANLPYIQAVYLEVMRWMPALLFSLPHSTTEDDVFKGFLIPKGQSGG